MCPNSLCLCSFLVSELRTSKISGYAGSGLRQGPFLANNLFPRKVGLRWVFVNGLKWVQKWVKSGFLGAKVGQNTSKSTFSPTLNPFWHIRENPLFSQFRGGGNCFLKMALKQSRPSINFGGFQRCMQSVRSSCSTLS